MDLSAQISIIATFAALASALGTTLTLVRLRRAEQANFYLEMTDRYNEQEMQESMHHLTQYYKADPQAFVEKWVAGMIDGKPEAQQLEVHRRRVNRYFANVAELYQAGYIDKDLAALVINYSGLNIWYQIAIPMGRAYYKGTSNYAEILKTIHRQYGRGVIR